MLLSGIQADYTITEVTYNTFNVEDNVGGDGVDTIIDINVLRFTDGDQAVVIQGLSIVGDSTSEIIAGGGFSDLIDGLGGSDQLSGNDGNDNVLGGIGNDTVNGNSGNDLLQGGSGNDSLTGGDGNDSVSAGDGNDLLVGGDGRGDDSYIGGLGFDTVKYSSSINATVTINLSTGIAFGAAVGTDRLSEIEGVIGGGLGDLIIGDSRANTFDGGGGVDTLRGGAGNDTYITGGGDIIKEGVGQGIDTVRAAVSYRLGANLEKLFLTGGANLNGTGNSLSNAVVGNSGSNTLNGGTGRDILTGGRGTDNFVFNSALILGNADKITDFNHAADTIRLQNVVFTGLSNGTLSESAFAKNTAGKAMDASDRILYETDTGKLFFDVDGTGGAAKIYFGSVGANLNITNTDFFVF